VEVHQICRARRLNLDESVTDVPKHINRLSKGDGRQSFFILQVRKICPNYLVDHSRIKYFLLFNLRNIDDWELGVFYAQISDEQNANCRIQRINAHFKGLRHIIKNEP